LSTTWFIAASSAASVPGRSWTHVSANFVTSL
jgi:hypothetical protein